MAPTYSEMGLQNLLDQARAGNQDAFGELFKHFEPRLKLMARSRLRMSSLQAKGDASGEVQDVYIAAFQAFGAFHGESIAEFEGWLCRILMNEFNHLYREFFETGMRDVTKEVSLDSGMPLPDPGSSPSSRAGRNEEEESLHEAIRELPEDEMIIVLLHDFVEITFTNIAPVFGISDVAVRNRYLKALVKLGERLEKLS